MVFMILRVDTTQMKSILILENDKQLLHQLEQLVKSLKCNCYLATSLTDGYLLLERKRPDLIILDRLLPDGDGLELATYVHEAFFTMRTLCISTLGTTPDRIQGLSVGIDDYLPKPFSLKELELKIKRLLYSEKVLEQESTVCGPIRYFPESGTIVYEHTAIKLRKMEAAILQCLCRHKNQVISRTNIINYVWQGQSDQPTTSTLDVYIRRIRSKLGAHSGLIKTSRGFGYSITDQ